MKRTIISAAILLTTVLVFGQNTCQELRTNVSKDTSKLNQTSTADFEIVLRTAPEVAVPSIEWQFCEDRILTSFWELTDEVTVSHVHCFREKNEVFLFYETLFATYYVTFNVKKNKFTKITRSAYNGAKEQFDVTVRLK